MSGIGNGIGVTESAGADIERATVSTHSIYCDIVADKYGRIDVTSLLAERACQWHLETENTRDKRMLSSNVFSVETCLYHVTLSGCCSQDPTPSTWFIWWFFPLHDFDSSACVVSTRLGYVNIRLVKSPWFYLIVTPERNGGWPCLVVALNAVLMRRPQINVRVQIHRRPEHADQLAVDTRPYMLSLFGVSPSLVGFLRPAE